MYYPDEVIAIDIGSTRTHIGFIAPHTKSCLRRVDVVTSEASLRLSKALKAVRTVDANKDLPPIIIGGGRTSLAAELESIAFEHGAQTVKHVRWHESLPVKFNYEPPDSIGADRIADALYCRAVWPDKNIIIIDSGTIIKIELLNANGSFLGGTMLPGVQTQYSSLHHSTEVLPHLKAEKKMPAFFGNSSESCMHSGILHGIAGALNHFVKQYTALFDNDCIIAATGGGWLQTEALVDFRADYVPGMTVIGIGLWQG